ncbi:MAG: efflux RND transporter periplasmic adaptor subunit [Rhodoblastus sp.]
MSGAKKALVVLVLALTGAAYWLWSNRAQDAGPLVLQGNVEVRQVNLGFKVAGRLKTLDVDEGAHVTAGQKLGSLDKVYFEDSLRELRAQAEAAAASFAKMQAGNRPEEIAQAEAAVVEREAAAANSRLAIERATRLLKTNTGTQKAHDDALAANRQTEAQLQSARQALALMKAGFRKEDIEVARAQLAQRRALIEIAERQLADADLFAPNDGVVLSRVREPGAILGAGETVFVLSLTSPVWVRTYVSEPDLGNVRPGMPVVLTTDTPGLKPLKGRIGFISPTAEFTPKTVETRELRSALVYRIRIVADDPDGVLRQGMPLTVSLAQDAQTRKSAAR